MSTLAEFLLARIAEDVEDACRCCDEGPGSWSYHLRAEAEAKRLLIERLTALAQKGDIEAWTVADEALSITLRTLAMPYGAYPEFRENWREP